MWKPGSKAGRITRRTNRLAENLRRLVCPDREKRRDSSVFARVPVTFGRQRHGPGELLTVRANPCRVSPPVPGRIPAAT